MPDKVKQSLRLAGFFAAFMFLQFTVLALCNRAGEGCLSVEDREGVYYLLQVFVILGFLAYATSHRLFRSGRAERPVIVTLMGLFLVGGAILLAADRGSLFYLIAAYGTVFCLGFVGGAVYERMSAATAAGARTARAMGLGCAAATVLQYLLQLQWGVTPLLPLFMLAALVLLGLARLRPDPAGEGTPPAIEKTSARRLVFTLLIAAALLLFNGFYNGYIHHLQVRSGYTDYNVYTWPRLMMIPVYLLFALSGDRRQGRLVPLTALCVALAALLNSVLSGSAGAYWLNMCLFYCAVASAAAYYNLTFWRLAQGTRRPALWASAGRIMDSVVVLLTYLLRVSTLSSALVLALDVAGLVLVLLLMTLGGDLDLAKRKEREPEAPPPPREDPVELLAARFALTPAELRLLRELVGTEDKQEAIAARLGMSVNTLRHHVTAIYRKTGAETRAGLVRLCAEEE